MKANKRPESEEFLPGCIAQVFEEDGKYIFAPGGNLTVFISNPDTPEELAAARVAFGWWEERCYTL